MSAFSRVGLIPLMLLTAAGVFAQEDHRASDGYFVGDHPKVLFDEGTLTEGPAQGPDGYLYFCDITSTRHPTGEVGHIWRLDLRSGDAEIFRSPSGQAGGLLFDLQGRLVTAMGANFGGRAVVRTDMESGRSSLLAGLHEGRRLNAPNDLDLPIVNRRDPCRSSC